MTPALIICHRIDEPDRVPVPGSLPLPCAICRATVLVSPSVLTRVAEESLNPHYMCVECGVEYMNGVQLLPPTAKQQAERAAAGGGEWPMRELWDQRLRRV